MFVVGIARLKLYQMLIAVTELGCDIPIATKFYISIRGDSFETTIYKFISYTTGPFFIDVQIAVSGQDSGFMICSLKRIAPVHTIVNAGESIGRIFAPCPLKRECFERIQCIRGSRGKHLVFLRGYQQYFGFKIPLRDAIDWSNPLIGPPVGI